jgi:hypothetical protein
LIDIIAQVLEDWSVLAKAAVLIIICAMVLVVVLMVVLWAPASTNVRSGLMPVGMAGVSGLTTFLWARKGRGPRS